MRESTYDSQECYRACRPVVWFVCSRAGADVDCCGRVLCRAADTVIARLRLEDNGRRQPQRRRGWFVPEERRKTMEEGPAAAAPAARMGERGAATGQRQSFAPAISVRLGCAQHVLRQHPEPGSRC